MKYRKNEPQEIPPNKKLKYQFLHTVISKEIAVFFCSTPFFLFSPYRLMYGNTLQNDALAVKRVRSFYVIICRFLIFHSGRSPPNQSESQKIQIDSEVDDYGREASKTQKRQI